MRIILIIFSAGLFIAFAGAQRKANITKPVVKLEQRPRPPVWNRPPEERRKLSIFPKTNLKFVVTPKSVERNENAAKEGLPTKRPLMRKFTMQDRNEKGTWSFAPREPLMKTNRFTVTLAPPKYINRAVDVMKPEESKKVKAVISSAKMEQPASKNHNLNNVNLVEMMHIQKNVPTASKRAEHVENHFSGEESSQTTKVNDTQNFDIIEMNSNSTSTFDKASKEYPIDIRSFYDENNIFNANETKSENGSLKLNQPRVTLKTEVSKELLESKAVDLNELKYAIEQNESNLLTMDSDENNNYSTAQILSFNDLEILLEKIMNNTESSAADFNGNKSSNSLGNDNKVTLENIPKFDVTKPNKFYDVISVSNEESKNTNLEEDFLDESILHGSLIVKNDVKHTASETNALNFTENVADSLVVGNLESLLNFMEKQTDGLQNHEIFNEPRDIVANNGKNTNDKPSARYPTSANRLSYLPNDTEYEIQNKFQKDNSFNDSESSKEILLEMYDSNTSLSSEEFSAESIDETPNKYVIENVNLPDENSNELNSHPLNGEEISNKLPSNMAGKELSTESSSSVEVISNESLLDTANNTGEETFNESSSHMADGVETSNESSYLTEENSNEHTIETSNNFTGEDFSNESTSNMGGEISEESYPDKSNNLTEETSNEYTIETSNNFTGEEISNESSSNMAAEISNESYPDTSNNLTKENSNEYTIETSNTGEEISNESSSNMAAEISNESYPDKSSNLTEETSNEYTIESSNNFSGEELSNESSSNLAVEEISNESHKSYNLTEEISIQSTIETHNDTNEETDMVIDERIADEAVGGSQETEFSVKALSNRFKRSNNIIEEENLPTTVSGFKYTGNDYRLYHDLSYRNINA